jgi:hypothetical protein
MLTEFQRENTRLGLNNVFLHLFTELRFFARDRKSWDGNGLDGPFRTFPWLEG